MKVAVTSTVVFEVPDGPIADVKQKFYEANVWAIGTPLAMTTVSGQPWRMVKIEQFEVERRSS